MGEIWRDVVGYEGKYKVSNLGNIKSIINGGKMMTNSTLPSGYTHVKLSYNGKVSTVSTHVIVAKAFIDNPDNKPQVNHIDGNKSNNRVDNLEWVTAKENTAHAIKNGLRPVCPTIGKFGGNSPISKPVLQFEKNGTFVKKWESRHEAAAYYGCHIDSIRNCTRGKRKTCVGYVWKYE